MTALDQYARLEATAIWRAGKTSQRRDVFVSLGEATLVIHDGKDVALGHWSLPAVTRINPGAVPARYAPGTDAPEELEIADVTMIEAIERVRTVVERGRPRSGRLRAGVVTVILIAVLALAILWMPGALVRQTASIVPAASRAAIGDDILTQLRPMTGPACRTSAGDLALARLKNRLNLDARHRLAVAPAGITGAVHLPGGLIILGREAVEDYETPEVVAGYVLAEAAVFAERDPLAELLGNAGIAATVRLLTSGGLPDGAIRAEAQRLVATRPDERLQADTLKSVFETAGVPISPYAYALDVTGETVLPLIEIESVTSAERRPILSDDDWVALQNICGA
jgi:hypothetical protein